MIGNGDPLHKGSSYAVLSQALRRLCGLEQGDDVPPAVRRERLLGRMGLHLGAEERRGVEVFLGELCGIPWPEDESAALKAARQDPRIMNEQITRALLVFLRAECAAHPVLLVLEDLHWCDAATVRLVDLVLRELAEEPLFVLALGRPEVKDTFPRLWQERSFQEMRLRGLSRRASMQLVRETLGPDVAPETVERLVERAEGNTLFLEELIRAEAEGAGGELPGTLLAMMQARFLRLAPGARQLLRAASLFGETFWRGGLITLLGAARTADEEVDRWLTVLMEQETVVQQAECRFAGETQYGFRHAFMREAAYSLLTEEDRRLGHRTVGRYLERMGETDAAAIAEHYRLGELCDRAAFFYARAAAQALDVSDLPGALGLAEQGLACQAEGEVLGGLRGVAAQAHVWQGNPEAGCLAGGMALELLPPGTAPWYRTGTIILGVLGVMGQREQLLAELRRFEAVEPLPGAESAFIECQSVGGVFSCGLAGLHEAAAVSLARLEKVARGLGPSDARALGLYHLGGSCYRLFVEGDPWPAWVEGRAAMEALERAEDRRFFWAQEGQLAFIWGLMGGGEQARADLQRSTARLGSIQEYMLMVSIQAQGAIALADGGSCEDQELARAMAESVIALVPAVSFWSGLAHSARAVMLVEQRGLGEAEAEARRALEAFVSSSGRVLALGLLCRILREQGRVAEARMAAEEGLTFLDGLGGRCWFDGKLRLYAAQALHAAGELAEAHRVLTKACRELQRRADQIEDPTLREHFRERVRDNAHTRALARDLGMSLPILESNG
jgi:hypothetical protein